MERQFEIIGEALGQLSKLEPQLADRIVWGVIQGGLQQLLRESSARLEQARGDVGP